MTRPGELSARMTSIWAKFDRATDARLSLVQHAADAADVAGRLWDEWLSPAVRHRVAESLGGDLEEGRTLVRWLAGLHDIGKATPEFSLQVPQLAGEAQRAGLPLPSNRTRPQDAPHSVLSQIVIEAWLADAGWDHTIARGYAVVPGGHHGVPPDAIQMTSARSVLDRMPAEWREVQGELLEHVTIATGAGAYLDAWSTRPLPVPAQVLVTGVVIVADWIASSADHFPLLPPAVTPTRADDGWARLGLRTSWRPELDDDDDAQRFASRFALPAGAAPRPVQREMMRLARTADPHSLHIVEAPMGEGKTELALCAVEILAARVGATGVFVALPTMATSDGMFRRVADWIARLPGGLANGPRTAHLAHGKARLNDDFRGLLRIDGAVFDDHTDEVDPIAVHTWLTGRKKGMLADFVVGTIDQALFGALCTRHVVLRHLALANKVVVIDEVHTSDAYMSVYLHRLLNWLGAYRVPTILMSATLAPELRQSLAAAYAGEVLARPALRPRSSRFPALVEERAYPLITSVTADGEVTIHRPEASSRLVDIEVERIDDSDATLLARLKDALLEGGSAAIIRNTVDRAQVTYRMLTAELDAEVVLVNSRFLARDRAELEARLRARLGPDGERDSAVRFGGRPFVVVGTQVLEQSLDVDVDVLVSDLAPIDLLLQRAGRLHRHERANRARGVSSPRLLVAGAEWGDQPNAVDGSVRVYGEFGLFGAALALDTLIDGRLRIPDDVPRLVAGTLGGSLPMSDEQRARWERTRVDWLKDIAMRHSKAQSFLLRAPDDGADLVDWFRGAAELGVDEDSLGGQRAVRDSGDSIEVLVVRRVAGEIRLPEWIEDGAVLSTDFPPGERLAYAAADCTVRLPSWFGEWWMAGRVIGDLEKNGFAGWQRSPLLGGQLVLALDERYEAEVAGQHLRYSRELGLEVVKRA